MKKILMIVAMPPDGDAHLAVTFQRTQQNS
jgi:hypothetical protein